MTKVLNPISEFRTVKHDIVPYTYVAASSFTLVIPHNLGYIPMALVYCVEIQPTTKILWSRFPLPGNVGSFNFTFGAAAMANWLDYKLDRTNLTITFQASLPGDTNIRNFDDFYNPIYFEYFLFETSAK